MSVSPNFSGQVVVVVGISSEIGKSSALFFGSRGAKIFLADVEGQVKLVVSCRRSSA